MMSDFAFHYNWLLDRIAIPMVTNKTTGTEQLEKAGNELFGNKFHGVYMSDQAPNLSKTKPYAIVNFDKSTDPGNGSHWIAPSRG